MDKNRTYEIEKTDYSQSANSLFHFMKEPEYLQEILRRKAIIPRYCEEEIGYLGISNGGDFYSRILVLQKCFCDIPLHKITQSFYLEGCGENFEKLTEAEKKRAVEHNTHPDFYGKYAIGFSKSWGEKHNLQPLHYINIDSNYVHEIAEWMKHIMEADDIEDIYADDILNRLTVIKPLRGIMKRQFIRDFVDKKDAVTTRDNTQGMDENIGRRDIQKPETIEIKFNKNFYDEQEWRYVPARDKVEACEMRSVIANPYTMDMKDMINNSLLDSRCKSLWLNYNYEEIRYIIVPDINARNEIIKYIFNLPDKLFLADADISLQKFIMISKILVLDEVRKDW